MVDPNKASGGVSAGSVLKESTGGLAGATILIVRRQLANLAERVGQRIVGSVLSRLVSVVAGGVGLVLIAKDIWEFRNGVLPIIATEMKAPATKEKVRDELASTLDQQMNDHVKEIAERPPIRSSRSGRRSGAPMPWCCGSPTRMVNSGSSSTG